MHKSQLIVFDVNIQPGDAATMCMDVCVYVADVSVAYWAFALNL